MSDGFEIRPFAVYDIEAAYVLMVQLSAHLGEELDLDPERFAAQAREMISRPGEYAQFVAVTSGSEEETADESSVAGFISIVFYRSFLHTTGTALINELVVASDFRSMGIGSRLVSRAFEEARSRGMDEIEVGAVRENAGALRFYRKNGFDEEYVLFGHEFE